MLQGVMVRKKKKKMSMVALNWRREKYCEKSNAIKKNYFYQHFANY